MLTSNPRCATSGFGDEIQLEIEKLVAHIARTFRLIGASTKRSVHRRTITTECGELQDFYVAGRFLRVAERRRFGIWTSLNKSREHQWRGGGNDQVNNLIELDGAPASKQALTGMLVQPGRR
jgi:hypothetical protein